MVQLEEDEQNEPEAAAEGLHDVSDRVGQCARWRRTSRTEGGASRICPARCPPDTKAKSGSWSGGGRPSQGVNRPQACAVSKYSTPDETHEIFF